MANRAKRAAILIAVPHGFCSGVTRAIKMALDAVDQLGRKPNGSPVIYCLNELVHNKQTVEKLREMGVAFVKSLDAVPQGSALLFSAHGVAPKIRREAQLKNLRIFDATCVFVQKIHESVRDYARKGYDVILIGSPGHDEVTGVRGEAEDSVLIVQNEVEARCVTPKNTRKIAVLTQTTLAAAQVRPIVNILKERFPEIKIPKRSGICCATTSRQNAVSEVARNSDIVIILGSRNSANSNRLVDVALAQKSRSILAEDIEDLETAIANGLLENVRTVGISAGASTPESFMQTAIAVLSRHMTVESEVPLLIKYQVNADGAVQISNL